MLILLSKCRILTNRSPFDTYSVKSKSCKNVSFQYLYVKDMNITGEISNKKHYDFPSKKNIVVYFSDIKSSIINLSDFHN